MAKKIPVLIRQRIVDEQLRDTSRLYDKYELTEAVQKGARVLGHNEQGLSVRIIDLGVKTENMKWRYVRIKEEVENIGRD